MSRQIVSKQRVADHGEVFTSQREVNAMLDLVKHETERIDSRFLEPACGTGNFLAEILERKLSVVDRRYRRSPIEHERYTLLAVSSIYGIDLLEDNVAESYLVVTPFSSKKAAQSFASYYRTRLFRFLVSLRKITQDALRSTYTWVPQQSWNRTWTDDLLYQKYGITKKEIAFIESMVRPMEADNE